MARKQKHKQQDKPKQMTKANTTSVAESFGTFVTLSLSEESVEIFLRRSTPESLTWIARNSLLATQAQSIRERYRHVIAKVGASSGVSTVAVEEQTLRSDQISEGIHFSAASPHVTTVERSEDILEDIKTPNSQAAQRTPSLKLKFAGTPTPGPTPAKSIPSTPAQEDTPNGSSKKRKRPASSVDPEQNGAALPTPRVSLKLNTKQAPSTSKNSAITPGIKLKTKGKIPKRPQGVGYDSELEDREVDPVLLEAFVLRMLPGDDCDYIRDAIANGTVGVSLLQKGADIRLRFLDVNGRRGILIVRGRQYAFTVVDLPTITEGMKSWDKKNFIKSVDISQMCLVLGRCADDEEARNYPLPPDVNPKNYQYAHGLTAPMRNVRKRRFERTTRTRLDDIEAVERKVNSLLEADAKATDTRWEVLDRDPRQDDDEYSDEYDSEEDAEGEEDGYFPPQNGLADNTNTPDQQIYTHEDISALEAMFEDEPEDDTVVAAAAAPNAHVTTAAKMPADSSSSTAPTPAADAEVDSEVPDADGDADADDDDPADADADDDEDSDHEASDEKAETLVKIKEAEEKIEQERKKLKGTGNHILKKKIATKITALENDIRMMRRHAGILEGGDGAGDDGSEEE